MRLFIGRIAYSVAFRAHKMNNRMNATKTGNLLEVYVSSLETWCKNISTEILSTFENDLLLSGSENWYDENRRSAWESKINKTTYNLTSPTLHLQKSLLGTNKWNFQHNPLLH